MEDENMIWFDDVNITRADIGLDSIDQTRAAYESAREEVLFSVSVELEAEFENV